MNEKSPQKAHTGKSNLIRFKRTGSINGIQINQHYLESHKNIYWKVETHNNLFNKFL